MNRRIRLSQIQIFFLIILLTFAAFIIVHPFTYIGGDEGFFAQHALRIEEGKIPIADYGARSPLLLLFMFLSVKIFGGSLLALRLPVVVATSLTAGFLYLLGIELFSKRIAVIAAIIFALNPYTLWNGVVIKSETLAILFGVIALWLLIKGLKQKPWYYVLFSGIFLGIGYGERRSVLALIFAVSIIIVFWVLFQSAISIRDKILMALRHHLFLWVGIILGFLPLFILVAARDLSSAWNFWFRVPYEIATLKSENTIMRPRLPALHGVFNYDFARGWTLTFVEELAIQSGLVYQGIALLLLCALHMILRSKVRNAYIITMLLGTIVFIGPLLWHSSLIYFIGTFRSNLFLLLALFSVPFFFIFIYYFAVKETFLELFVQYIFGISVILIWFFAFIIAYSLKNPGYLREFIPSMVFATAFVMVAFPWRFAPKSVIVTVALLIAGFLIVGVMWFDRLPKTSGFRWSQDEIISAAMFLEEHTQPGEDIFAANPLPVILAQRRAFDRLYSSLVYNSKHFDDRLHKYASTPRELYRKLTMSPPRYVVFDKRMKQHIISKYPIFGKFIEDNYYTEVSFGGGRSEIKIMKRK